MRLQRRADLREWNLNDRNLTIRFLRYVRPIDGDLLGFAGGGFTAHRAETIARATASRRALRRSERPRRLAHRRDEPAAGLELRVVQHGRLQRLAVELERL